MSFMGIGDISPEIWWEALFLCCKIIHYQMIIKENLNIELIFNRAVARSDARLPGMRTIVSRSSILTSGSILSWGLVVN